MAAQISKFLDLRVDPFERGEESLSDWFELLVVALPEKRSGR
jgi:hypothetical protein